MGRMAMAGGGAANETGTTPLPRARHELGGLDAGSLERALRASVRGEVKFDAATRGIYATDSSNYRHIPIAVVLPRDRADVIATLQACAAHDAPVLARGAGTSLAGQACNAAVILDTSRFMRRILEIDPDQALARVEPGVVLDDLQAAAAPYGLMFGPDPATHGWCTLGGMIGNNACGSHALYGGKTVDNVERLVVATYEGEVLELGAWEPAALEAAIGAGDRTSAILRELRALADRAAPLVRERFPSIPRRVSGFNLDQLLPENGFHVARSLVGTESTCVVILEATLRLIARPAIRRLVLLGYPDVFEAASAVPSLLPYRPIALEGFDRHLVTQMRQRNLHVDELGLLPDAGAWLMVEFGANDRAAVVSAAADLIAAVPSNVLIRDLEDERAQRQIWAIRESALGATAIRPDGRHNVEGWEDAAVAPERLAEYLAGITGLWEEFGYSGAWYGHFGQGCVHTRNDFDLHSPDGLRRYRAYVTRAADLVVSLGGSLSGEHGDGQSRGELLERMYGPELVGLFREFKRIFDPRGRMNPGKVVDAYPLDANLRFGPGHVASPLDEPVFGVRGAEGLQSAVERCVGVGRCRIDGLATMCPSYRVTRDEMHSTRGRAKLLAEMFQGSVTPATWRNDDVRAALDLCLSCKACSVDCPTGVDMATYKAQFLSHYYAGRLRPPAMYALGFVPWLARVGTRVPRVANALARSRLSALRRLAGITTRRPLPAFAATSWRRSETVRTRSSVAGPTVVIWPDTFTDAFRPGVGDDLVALLEAFGERPVVPTGWGCCGRTLYDAGMLKIAKRALRAALDVLAPWIEQGLPVIVPEPSCLAAFRDEMPKLLDGDSRARRLAGLVRSPAEHLLASGRLPAGPIESPGGSRPRAVVHPHCHARATSDIGADREVLERAGYRTELLDAGCCGLAGSFGFRTDHEALSRRIGAEQWLPRVREHTLGAGDTGPGEELTPGRDAALVVDGFSCVMQLDHLDGPAHESLVHALRRGFGV